MEVSFSTTEFCWYPEIQRVAHMWCKTWDAHGHCVDISSGQEEHACRLTEEWLGICRQETTPGEGIIANCVMGYDPDGTERRMSLLLVSTAASRERAAQVQLEIAQGQDSLDPVWAHYECSVHPECVVGNVYAMQKPQSLGYGSLSLPFHAYLDSLSCIGVQRWRERFGRVSATLGGHGAPAAARYGLRCLLGQGLQADYWSEYYCRRSREGLRVLDLFERQLTPNLVSPSSEPKLWKWYLLNSRPPWFSRQLPDPTCWHAPGEWLCVGQKQLCVPGW